MPGRSQSPPVADAPTPPPERPEPATVDTPEAGPRSTLLGPRSQLLAAVACSVALAGAATALLGASGPILATDEVGYLSGGLHFSTRDVAPHLTFTPFYSVGYSLLLVPLLSVTSLDPWLVGVLVNLALVATLAVVTWFGARRLFDWSSGNAALLGFVSAAYPAVALQASRAWAEVLLMTLTTAWVAVAGLAFDRRGVHAHVLAGLGAFAFVAHGRMLPLAAVTFAWLVLLARRADNRRRVLAALATFSAVLIAGQLLERAVQNALYGEVTRGADAASYLSEGLFTAAGIGELVVGMAGQLWYLQVATFGLFGVGVLAAVAAFRRPGVTRTWAGGVLIAFVGLLVLSAAVHRGNTSRVDLVVYGRYVEVFVPAAVLVAASFLRALSRRRRMLAVSASAIVTMMATVVLTLAWDPTTFEGNVQKLTIPGVLALNLLGGGAGSVFAQDLDVGPVTAASVALAAALAVAFGLRARVGVSAVGAFFAVSTLLAAHYSLGPFTGYWSDLGTEVADAVDPPPERIAVVDSEEIAKARNMTLYRWGFPDVQVVAVSPCPAEPYFLASSELADHPDWQQVAQDPVLDLALYVSTACP